MTNNLQMQFSTYLRIICVVLFLVGVAAYSYAAVIIDNNISHIQENECITLDFLEKYEPSHFPAQEPVVFTVNYHTAKEITEILTMLYGCDIITDELMFNPENEYQDGTVYMIWGYTGRNADGSLKTIFTLPHSKLKTLTKMSFDERIYSTLEEALNSVEMKRSISEYGAEKMYVQGFTLKGEDKGLVSVQQ